jgi:methyltransferase (TIGR00027 family)
MLASTTSRRSPRNPDHQVALPEVSQTAVGVAAIRALESARPDRLFDDGLAAEFVAATGQSLADRTRAAAADANVRRYWEAVQIWVVIRTRFLDDFVVNACTQGCRQVVLLGAGLDARAFRLELPAGVRFFELDLPGVLQFKQQVVDASVAESKSPRLVVPCDLNGDWPAALTAAGFRSDVPSAWIAEGLLVYLTDEENADLFARVGALSAPGSQLALTIPDRDREGSRMARPASVRQLWRSAGIQDPETWLGERGWAAQVFDAAERAAFYGRPHGGGDATPARSSARLVMATRR